MRNRLALILPAYLAIYAACYWSAFQLRFDFEPDASLQLIFWVTLPIVLAVKLGVTACSGEFRRTLRHVATSDFALIFSGTVVSFALLQTLNTAQWLPVYVPRSVLCIDAALTLLAVGVFRSAYRVAYEIGLLVRQDGKQRALIFGVGEASVGILRMLTSSSAGDVRYCPIGFVDDDPRPHSSLIGGLPVYPLSIGWTQLLHDLGATHLLIPGDTPGKFVRSLWEECKRSGIEVHVIPSVGEIVDGRFKVTIRDLTVSDLLRREPNVLDTAAIRKYVTGQRVLITGAAGSIGSELCRQVLDLHPAALVLYDQSEYGMFTMEQEFSERDQGVTQLHYVVADILDQHSLEQVMAEHRPQLVFHAAAYKHVPLMEDNPQAAVLNNVLGTQAVAECADRAGVERFVLISTDKAVRPTSVMGASKLVAEKFIQSLSEHSPTRFITVRFGNVLNSMGSVVPTFRAQIEAGGPITVTHPEMRRFFMTIPEAVQLVLQAGAVGESGDILILDMGEPVRIVDLAKDMIALSGLRYPDDIDIVFTGMRPGEKLYEELFYIEESGAHKVHEKIYCGRRESAVPLPAMLADISYLAEAAANGRDATLAAFREVVAKFTDREWVPSRLQKAA